jgi:hypothetical protein
MKRLALLALIAAAASPVVADDCVTTTLNLVYFTADPHENVMGLTDNLGVAPEDDFAGGPAPPPPPSPIPPDDPMIGGLPDCPPIVRPASDPTARLVCDMAPGLNAWICHTDALGNLVIEDVRYASVPPPDPPVAAPQDGGHGGSK